MIWTLIRNLIPGAWKWLAAAGAALVGILGIYAKGRADAKAKQAVATAKADQQAHERMNDADLGIGATDGERIDRLRDFAAKHGNQPSKRSGGGLR